MIFQFTKPSAVQNWIAVNAAGSLKTTPRDSWRAYLVAQLAVGQTINELELSWLSASGSGVLYDRWITWLTANGSATGDARAKFQNKFK